MISLTLYYEWAWGAQLLPYFTNLTFFMFKLELAVGMETPACEKKIRAALTGAHGMMLCCFLSESIRDEMWCNSFGDDTGVRYK